MHTLKEYYIVPAEVLGIDLHHPVTGLLKVTGSLKIKAHQFTLHEHYGIRLIFPNGRGVRLLTLEELNKLPLAGWVWKLKRFTPIPPRLWMLKDELGQYHLAPRYLFPLSSYKGILIGMGMRAERVWKKTA